MYVDDQLDSLPPDLDAEFLAGYRIGYRAGRNDALRETRGVHSETPIRDIPGDDPPT